MATIRAEYSETCNNEAHSIWAIPQRTGGLRKQQIVSVNSNDEITSGRTTVNHNGQSLWQKMHMINGTSELALKSNLYLHRNKHRILRHALRQHKFNEASAKPTAVLLKENGGGDRTTLPVFILFLEIISPVSFLCSTGQTYKMLHYPRSPAASLILPSKPAWLGCTRPYR